MKQNKFFTLMATMLLAMAALVSCSDDDDNDGGNAATPQYESIAAKYDITTANSPYESVEFTASGNYIIIQNGSRRAKQNATRAVAPKSKLSRNPFVALSAPRTRASYNQVILTGTYTYADGVYKLDNNTTVSVTVGEDGSYYNVVFTSGDGTTSTFEADKSVTQITNSAKSNLLCRTWNLTNVSYVKKHNGKTVFTWSGSDYKDFDSKWAAFLKQNYPSVYEREYGDDYVYDDDDDNFIDQMIFTKSGTFLRTWTDKDGTKEYDYNYWRWQNESAGILLWAEPEDVKTESDWTSTDEDIWEQLTVAFSGNNLVMAAHGYETEAEFLDDYSKDQENEHAWETYAEATFHY